MNRSLIVEIKDRLGKGEVVSAVKENNIKGI